VVTGVSELASGNGRGAYAELDDRLLVLDFQAGNEADAFDEIHRRYSGLARHISQNILQNPEDAEEATQETMFRVYRGLARFNGRYMVQPWVARIATNVSLDIVRARQRRPVAHLSLDHADEAVAEPEDRAPDIVVERKLEQARVTVALDALPPQHRRALIMREFEGRSHQEIARALEITPNQAKALIHRAKARFRRVWDGERHGLAVIVPILLAPLRLPESVRRLIGSAGEAAAGGGAATPIVSSAVVSAGERVAAAAVAVAMVTTLGVGAVALKDGAGKGHDPARHPNAQETVVDAPAALPDAGLADTAHKIVSIRHARASATTKKEKNPKPATVQPIVSPSESPMPTPSAEPSGSPSPDPTDTTPPPPPPAPDWSMKFSAVDKSASMTLLESRVSGVAGKQVLFSQAATGTLGRANPIAVHAEYWGSADGPAGTANLWLFLDTPSGRYRYDGTATLHSVVSSDDGTTSYSFTGTFVLVEWPQTDLSPLGAKMPHDGTFELSLSYWQDRASLYQAGLELSSTPATGS
jgi:RNA polymerase sigma-70 factor, ECF subfamily